MSAQGKRPAPAPQTASERYQAMSWVQRLKRVFQIDLSQCPCGGRVKLIDRSCASMHGTSIEQQTAIHRILEHLEHQAREPPVR